MSKFRIIEESRFLNSEEQNNLKGGNELCTPPIVGGFGIVPCKANHAELCLHGVYSICGTGLDVIYEVPIKN